MKQWLINRIKKLGENIESSITQVIVLALFGGSLAILAFWKKALDLIQKTLIKPTPLWITIILGLLCCLYIHSNIGKYPFDSPKLKREIDPCEIEILKYFFNQIHDDNSSEGIAEYMGLNLQVILFHLINLENRNMITSNHSNEYGIKQWSILQDGRDFLISNKHVSQY